MNNTDDCISFNSPFRVDIKCINNQNCINIEASNCNISQPTWFQSNGDGFVLECSQNELSIIIHILRPCSLSIRFRGPDIRVDNVRVPVWVAYKSIAINDKQLLKTPILSWHDVPYIHNLDCEKQGSVKIQIEQCPYSCTKDDFLNGIISFNSKYLKQKIDDITHDFLYHSQSNCIGNFWQYRTNMLKMNEREKEKALKQYYEFLDKKNSWIAHSAIILSEPIFPHGLSGIFISGGAQIGKNAVIFQQVTIGSNTLEDSKSRGAPIIGDNVYIGAGAKIIGKVRIGNNVRIGANAVVVKDVPDNSVVVMEKPRVIHKDNMDNKFYHFLNGVYGYHLDGKFFPVKKN